MADQLFLIDGSALAYRAFFAFAQRPLVNSKGEDTSVAYGFVNTLLKLRRDHRPAHMALVFDTGAPTFRHQMHPDYKATRVTMPQPMRSQLPRLDQLAAAFGLPVFRHEGYEADDVIGTLAGQAQIQGLEVAIVTSDKDFMQLVTPQLKLFSPRRGEDYQWVDAAAVRDKFGVDPEQMTDLLALAGDTSDNVPGVPGIGPKTAAKLIEAHGNLETILQNAPQVKQRNLRQKLQDYADQARLSKELVIIRTDCPVELDLEQTATSGFDPAALATLFEELEFLRLLEQLEVKPKSQQRPAGDHSLINDATALTSLLETTIQAGRFAIAVQAEPTDPLDAQIIGIALSLKAGQGVYFPIGHSTGTNLELAVVLGQLKPLLENPDLKKVTHDLKPLLRLFKHHGINPQGFVLDTLLADYLLASDERPHTLEAQALHHLSYQPQPLEERVGKGKQRIAFADLPPSEAAAYTSALADTTLSLADCIEPQLEQYSLRQLYNQIEMPLVAVLADMEEAGVALDVEFLSHFATGLNTELQALQEEAYRMAGGEFNLNSSQQLGHILFEKIGLKPGRKTKTGYSTDVNVLEELAQQHELPGCLLEYRELNKLKTTYVDVLPALVHPRTGRVHTTFNQAVTATGRLSSSEPNLQNIPIRTPRGRQIRKAFVAADEAHCILSADYSQIELRLLAHLSGDEALIEAFDTCVDIHARTASLVFNLMPAFITPQMRAQAKTVNFGVVYGQSAFGLARQLGIPLYRARTFIESYFEIYGGVKTYIAATIEAARRNGYVTTLMGRRRTLPEINAPSVRRREFAERTAINTPIQGSQADMIKWAMIQIHHKLQAQNLDARMILQVHDELVFEVAKTDLAAVQHLVETQMKEALDLDVPIEVECGHGPNWFEAH